MGANLGKSHLDEQLEDAKLVKYDGYAGQQDHWVEEYRAREVPCDVVRGEPGKQDPDPDWNISVLNVLVSPERLFIGKLRFFLKLGPHLVHFFLSQYTNRGDSDT